MANGLVLNIGAAPTITKVLPFIGIAAGYGLYVYEKKSCIGCLIGFTLGLGVVASLPLLYTAKEAGNKLAA